MENGDEYATRQTLIQRVRDQYDEHSWKEFLEVYNGFIYSIIRKMNINADDTKDIQQKVIIKLWDALPELDPKQIVRFRSYLSVVTKNNVIDFMRKRSRQMKYEDQAAEDSALSYWSSISLPEIEAIAEKEWQLLVTNKAYENIKLRYPLESVEILDHALKGETVEGTVEKMGLPLKHVYNMRSRMKKRFAKEIKLLRKELE